MERFRNDINRYRNKTGMPWAALSEKAGVSPAMFTRIKKGSAVTLEAFAQLCSSFQLNPIDYDDWCGWIRFLYPLHPASLKVNVLWKAFLRVTP